MAAAIPPKVSKWFDVLVSVAAAVVLFGALQKILHTAIADLFLQIGLYTEAAIFLGYGILYLKYPAIDDHQVNLVGGAGTGDSGNKALEKLEKLLDYADITPENLSKLSAGFQKLGNAVENLGEISNAVSATTEYTAKTKQATAALSTVIEAYSIAAASVSVFNNTTESTKGLHDQVQVLTKNLSSLNTIYELELKESNSHLKVLNQFYGKLTDASTALDNSADDAKKAQEQIAALANNLGKLNQVYGNMINAMQAR